MWPVWVMLTMKKTAVELLKEYFLNEYNDMPSVPLYIFDEFSEIEKQNMRDAFNEGDDCIFYTFEEYYETKFIQPE